MSVTGNGVGGDYIKESAVGDTGGQEKNYGCEIENAFIGENISSTSGENAEVAIQIYFTVNVK